MIPDRHPTAVIGPRAVLEAGACVGAYAVIDGVVFVGPDGRVGPHAVILADVRLGARARIGPHAIVQGPTDAGDDCVVEPRALVGGVPQHVAATAGALRIGDGVRVGERATVHRGSSADAGITVVGPRCLLMADSHVGHDVVLGEDVVLAQGATLGGHVQVGPRAFVGAMALVHQRVRIGDGAFVAAGARVEGDVPPYTMAAGDRARLVGPNLVGLRRAGYGDQVDAFADAWRRWLPRPGLPRPIPECGVGPIGALAAFLLQRGARPLAPRGR